MLRDSKSSRRYSGKNSNAEEFENMPVNPRDSLVAQITTDPIRAPLNTIQEPNPGHTSVLDQDLGGRSSSKIERTPTKPKNTMPTRTPDKSAKNRFGWAQKNESSLFVSSEARDEGRGDVTGYVSQAGRGIGVGNGGFGSMGTPRSTRTMGRPNAASSYTECNSTQSTPTKSVSKPPNPGYCPASVSRPHVNGGPRVGNFFAMSKGLPVSCTSSSVVNTADVPHFDLKEDPSFWMEHNVQVLIRVRPLNSMERSMNGYHRCLKQESAQCITWTGQPETRFTFDHVACETVDQETLFRMVGLPMVENCLSGYNSCMFAYGQTGSGKTFTMLGEIGDLQVKPSPHRGMTPRIFEFLFARIRAEEESRRDERLKYYCKCSFLEIYNEQICDLLDPSSTNLLLREDTQKGVYVDNLSEFEVQTVGDILKLLSQGSANRKVASTNMNRESSRSHSVFTCVIESRWEKDAMSNLRFSRLNLVDLAGSERQKSSGAEGERLKEAANINKSLSTLGHVIMVLVDVANGKPKHVPYRDSRLTFLLQDSLGGNSKTMIIANVSPSICCAAETLNTLKFAQRAKLIQNNAVVNEDSSGDVITLQHQIRLLKEELSALKRQNVSRALSFGPKDMLDITQENDSAEMDLQQTDKCVLKLSSKQFKSLECTLAGALRREKMAETYIKQLEAEIEQLNCLVRQREEDTRCTKMMLKFREDKIQRMESVVGGLLPADNYLLEENSALSEEIQLLQAKVERNPEVTRFALENIRLLEQLRRFQDFYEEGEKEMLLDEVAELRDQLVCFLDGNSKQHNHPKVDGPCQEAQHVRKEHESLHLEVNKTLSELEECRNNLTSCLEENARLRREIDDLHASLSNLKAATHDHDNSIEVIKEPILEAPRLDQSIKASQEENGQATYGNLSEHTEDVMKVQLEVDILNIMLKEERSSHAQVQARELCLNRDLEETKENILLITRLFEDVKEELKEAKSVIEALESQQILSINEMEDLRSSNSHYVELLSKKELEISTLKEQISCHEFRAPRSFKCSESEDSSFQGKLKKMHDSLEKARRLNTRYQSDIEFQESNEEEMDEVRRQVEAETAEVIVCLQDEISILQQQVEERSKREVETEERLLGLQTELKDLQEKMHLIEQDNSVLGEKLEEKDEELRTMYRDEVRRQVEAETAEVIFCLQDEISILRLQVEESSKRKVESEERLLGLQTELKDLQEKMHLMEQENSVLGEKLEKKDEESRTMYKEWELLTNEIELLLSDGHEALKHASDQLDSVSSSFPWQRNEIPQQVGRIRKVLSEKEFLIENLNQCLEDADRRRSEMECMLRSLRGAALVITEAHQQECREKEKEILLLSSELNSRKSTIEELEKRIKHGEEEIQKASIRTTAAFVIVNRFSEINSTHLDALEYKDVSLSTQTAEIGEAKRQIESLARELNLSKESCSELRLQLSQEQNRACAMEQKLEEARESDILQTTEKLAELKNGVSAIKYCINEYAERVPIGEEDNAVTNHVSLLTGGICEARTGGETRQRISNIDSYVVEDLKMEIPETPREYSSVQKKLASGRIRKDESDRDATIILLKKEIESALDSLKGVQAEMARLRSEKEKVWMSEKESKESIKSFLTQVLSLQAGMINFEEVFGTKMESLDYKLRTVEEAVQNSGSTWCQEKELLELELGDAKAVAVQKAGEASCVLAKFEEVQDTMKDADIMINELVIANETAKLQNVELKRMRFSLITEKDILIQEVQSLQTENNQKDCHYENLEKLYSSDLSEMKNLVLELEDINSQVQTTFNQDFASIASEFLCMKSQLQSSRKLIHSWIEDIWSEIFVKDCALSVLHLCHMGILLETVTGLNAENGLLHHGLSESNSVISDLREHNFKSRRELEMCRILKGKLLADMKSGFDRISRKEDETSELTVKLTSFEKRLLDLQLQEESMLQRSNHMGSELAILTKELDLNNRYIVASQVDQEKYVKEQHEVLKSQEENFVLELSAKDFELLVLLSELEQMDLQKAKMEKEKLSCSAILQDFKRELILLTVDAELKESICVDKEVEISLLRKEVEEVQRKSQEFLSKMNESNAKIADIGKTNEALEQDIQLLKGIALSNETLKGELGEVTEAKMRLLTQMQNLEAKYERLVEDIKTKEDALEISSSSISALDQQNKGLQDDISLLESSLSELQVKSRMKDVELSKMSCLEEENECLENELRKLKAEFCSVNGDLEEKKSEVESYINHTDAVDKENNRLLDEIISLKSQISHLKGDLDRVRPELSELQLSESVARDKLCSKTQDLQIHVDRINSLKQENVSLRNELQSQVKHNTEFLSLCDDSFANVEKVGSRISQCLHDDSANSEKVQKEMREVVEMIHRFMEELESLEELAKELVSENSTLQMELSRKDDVLKGLLFDLSMLQESTSNTKDQKDEIEELAASINALEDEHAVKLCELDEAVSNGQVLEAQLQEKTGIICSLQLDISKMHETVESLSSKNLELTANMENALEAKRSIEEELVETRKANETLEVELVKMEAALREMNNCIESLKGDLDGVIIERDGIQSEVLVVKENLEMARALAEENDAIAVEALETAECRKRYAEEKEEEVKLLERSVEELECTVNVLENKVDIVKGEVERQRLEREELEVELEAVKQQMNHVKRGDTEMRRHLDEKEKNLQEAFQRIQILEREIAARDAEIAQCKVHITELNLHAEAQASEYKQKFKSLEAMAEQVKPEGHPTHAANSPSRKLEKNQSRSRGSGSPFKCIGLGLVQQIKSERDEELSAGRARIEELEALAATRQKEIFMLNTKLAATESMTHDVIRDLLGVKLDMTNYASLLDNQQVQKITEKARLHNSEAQEVKDQEAMKLKQQLNEFIEERRGWLEEIDRKQAEVVAARIALEELHQQNHLITAEMEMCKVENTNQKRRIMELEAETKKLSGQQNLQQRIHHHAKIKEENNFLRSQNDDLTMKLRRSDAIVARVKEELAKFRASNGRSPFINFDEEQRLNTMLKETEEERLQLAQKLVGLCTSILKAAGITNPVPEVNLSIAEEALEQLKNRITSLERELQDVRFKNRITSERVRLSELMPQPSPLSLRADKNRRTPNRASQTPFLSALDR